MAQVKVNTQRLVTIKKRQGEDKWGRDYVAAIFATPKEAPSISRPSILVPQKLGGRDMHLLSNPEKSAALLALYNPQVWEIHEQKALSTGPRPHFLFGHPRAQGTHWPPLKGTLDVANRMGRLAKHPKVKFKNSRTGEWQWAPFPLIGDQLLFMQDDQGAYCKNWTIKDKYVDFKKRGPHSAIKPSLDQLSAESEARHELEKLYYLDGEIGTIQVAGEAIHKDVVANLGELFLHHWRRETIDPALRQKIVEKYNESVGEPAPCFELIAKFSQRFLVEQNVLQAVLRQGIWQREIRVDLYQPILMDQPLRPEKLDVLDQHSNWFQRKSP